MYFRYSRRTLVIILYILCFGTFISQASFVDSTISQQIIRQAIAVAPQHRQATSNYAADIFLQYQGSWQTIPKIWQSLLLKEGVQDSLVYQSESYAHLEVDKGYNYCYTYQGVRNNFHTAPRADRYVNPNFYEALVGPGAISPLAPKALQLYDFQLVKTIDTPQGKAYQLAIQPKHHNDEKVFSGTITLDAQHFWLKEVNLTVKHYAILYHIQASYAPVGDRYMPVFYHIETTGALMGFTGKYQYTAHISHYQLGEIKPCERPAEDSFKEIYNLQERNFEVQQFKQVMQSLATNLQNMWSEANMASGLGRFDKVVVNTQAHQQPDAWWKEVRPDSLAVFGLPLPIASKEKNTLPPQPDEYATYRQTNLKFGIGSILFSRSFFWGNNSKGFYPHEIYYKSPVLDFNFNTVEGFVQNTGALYRYRTARYNWFEIDPTWRYSYDLEKSSGTLKIRWKTEQEDYSITGGKFVSQYNVDTPIAFDLNSLSTLLLKKNYVKIYEKEFVNLSLLKRFSNTWTFRSSVEWARRYLLQNTTDYYWVNLLNESYLPNSPSNKELSNTEFQTNDAFLVSFQVNYRPTLKKQYRNGLRLVDLSSSPLFTFKYRGAINGVMHSNINYHTIELGVTHNFPISINTNFNYIAQAGTFFNTDAMTFADYKHFNGNNNMISIGNMLTTHRLVGFYDNYVWGASKKFIDPFQYSTNGTYIDIMTMMGFRKLLISRLNFAKKLALREEFFANYLYTANKNYHYAEFGYGIDGIARIFRIEFGYRIENGRFTKDSPSSSSIMPIIRIALNSRVRGGVTPEW